MIDEHIHLEGWGILPSINFLGISISTYSLFVLLALLVGGAYYFFASKNNKEKNENIIFIGLLALIGGIIGAKVPIWILNFRELFINNFSIVALISGRTITGGIIGGTIGVLVAKKMFNIKGRKGNYFAPGMALGIAVGRIGCLLSGCCYGTPTALSFGVNFGDGILRHPTQAYESLAMLLLFLGLFLYRHKAKDGELFYLFLNGYFIFRFFVEFIRVNEMFFGLSIYQWISIVVIIYANIKYREILIGYFKKTT